MTEFRHNGELLPYSPFDSVRWQDAIFEEHSTLTFKVNEPIQISLSNGVPRIRDMLRDWELAATAGGRYEQGSRRWSVKVSEWQ